ncbi:hypothetical protein ACOME3_008724 [Neoechinorhynchus agilis]
MSAMSSERSNLIEKFRDHVNSKPIIAAEINKANALIFLTNDEYVFAILSRAKFNLTKACEILKSSLKWRNEFGPKNIAFTAKDSVLIEKGVFYIHGTSKQGNRIFRFDVSKFDKRVHKKKSYQRLIVYLLEKHLDDLNRPLLFLFNLTGSGLNQVDFELIRFLKSCFEEYYPHLFEQIIAYDMPWIMNAAWAVVSGWLEPEAVCKIQFVNSETALDFIDEVSLPLQMGGNDMYIYSGDPYNENELDIYHLRAREGIVRDHPLAWPLSETFKNKVTDSNIVNYNQDTVATSDDELFEGQKSKPVEFYTRKRFMTSREQAEERNPRNVSFVNIKNEEKDSSTLCGYTMPAIENEVHKPLNIPTKNRTSTASAIKEYLVIRPANVITMQVDKSTISTPPQIISLTNTGTSSIIFKIRTTSSQKFRFSQATGIICPYGSIKIRMYLSKDAFNVKHMDEQSIDKLQILYKKIDDANLDTDEFWKTIDLENVHEYRLQCHVIAAQSPKVEHVNASINTEEVAVNPRPISMIITITLAFISILNLLCLISIIIWRR